MQLHSEYRSTYRWHEYTPKQQSAVVRTAPTPQPLTSSGNQSNRAANQPSRRFTVPGEDPYEGLLLAL